MTKNDKNWLASLDAGGFITIRKIQPAGALQARKQASGAVSFVWRYASQGVRERVAIGLYDPAAPPRSLTPTDNGFTLAAAVRAAETFAVEHYQHRETGGRPALLAARREREQAAIDASNKAAAHTLQNLLADYCDHLKALGRRAHAEARSIFKLHVCDAWPQYAGMPASQVEGEHVADMMRRLLEAGKGRTANKLRSYVRAAYQTAKSARSKPSVPVSFKAYGIISNPAVETEPDESHNRTAKNPLSVDELRMYWGLIKHLEGFKGGLLRLHLLTGGQRIDQLVRLRTSDIADTSIKLHDGKGRPGRPPRVHLVPLIDEAVKALERCSAVGVHALSTDDGATHVAGTTLSAWACSTAKGYIKGFKAKRVRSGVETLLASAGVSQDIRGRLQSHGISGVQARSYDGHDYMPEKRKALETLYALLSASSRPAQKPRTRVPKDVVDSLLGKAIRS